MKSKYGQRDAKPETERYRTLNGSAQRAPSTLNDEDRSVEVVMSTEDAVSMGWYDEVLLMSGATGPEQIPLLDSHSRYSVKDQLGSVRDIRKEGEEMIGRAYYASDADSEAAFTKMKEGHATDYSIGYMIRKEVRIDEGQTAVVGGRSFTAKENKPLYVVTEWDYRELSQTPIGADGKSKARSEQPTSPKPIKEKKNMDPRIRAYLESIGLRADASEEEAQAMLEALPEATRALAEAAAKEESEGSEAGERSEGEGETRNAPVATVPPVKAPEVNDAQRTANILAAGRDLGLSEMAQTIIIEDSKISETEAFRKLHAAVQERSSQVQRPGIQVIADQGDKFRAAGVDAMILRSSLRNSFDLNKPAPGAETLRGFSLVEMAREALRVNGKRIDGSVSEMVGRAMVTDDFNYLLANVANKSLNIGWDTAEETWSTCFASGTVNDFKQNSRPRLSEFDDLDEIKEGGEYKYGSVNDDQEVYQLAKYGKLFMITREAIINDDLDSLTAIPSAMGESAARKVGDVAWAVFTANANMGDGNPLFDTANHGNLASSGGALSITTLGAAETAMGLQKDQRGLRRLGIRPNFFIAPLTIKTNAEVFFQSQMIGTQAQPNQNNIYAGNYFTRVYEPRLDDDSTTAWYLAAMKGKTVTVFFLNGAERPYMEEKMGFNVDGAEYKVRMEATAKALDWRGVYKNPGA